MSRATAVLVSVLSLGASSLAAALPPSPAGSPSPVSRRCMGLIAGDRIHASENFLRSLLYQARLSRDRPGGRSRGEEALARAKNAFARLGPPDGLDSRLSALLGEWDLLMVQYRGFPSGMSYGKKAQKANDRALSLDPDNPEAHLSKGIELYFKPWFVGGSVAGALKEFRRADSLRPGDPRILSWIGIALHGLHRPNALFYEKEAVGLCPDNPLYLSREKTLNPRADHR